MIGIVEFYRSPDRNYRRKRDIGQFFLAPVPFRLSENIPRLRVDYYDKTNPRNSAYTVETVNMRSFDPTTVEPVHELRLPSDAFVLCVAYKLRPVIILSKALSDWADYQKTRGNTYLVAPLYSTKDAAGNYKFSEEFLLRAQAYEYPELFYLPERNEFGARESLVRFDRLFCVNEDLLQPKPRCLTDDAFYCATKWLHYFLGADLDDLISEFREISLQNIASQ